MFAELYMKAEISWLGYFAKNSNNAKLSARVNPFCIFLANIATNGTNVIPVYIKLDKDGVRGAGSSVFIGK